MKVERVSYPLLTPSAARGALEAILWKPEFHWVIEEISVLKPIRWASILRNEINNRQSERVAREWQNAGRGGYDATAPDRRAQRHSLVLRDVAYIVRAQMRLRPHATDDIAKYRDQFRRRVERGQCFATPFLGCREFSASFGPPDGTEQAQPLTEELGPMLLDIDYDPDPAKRGRGTPRFFSASLVDGVMSVPDRFAEVT
jgi:CRISPR-associated protein Cas5d